MPQHLSGWQEVQRQTYGHQPYYLMAREGDQAVGVLPLFFIRSIWLGNTLRTMPGGMCADNDEVALALIERGRKLAQAVKARRFFIADSRQVWPGNLLTTTDHVCWILDLQLDPETLWMHLDDNIRRQVRIARDHKLRVAIDRTGQLLATFYTVFSDFSHQMGTPLFSLYFLENVVRTFPSGFSIAVVYLEDRPLGAYFQLELGNTIYGMWGGTPHQFLKMRPVYLAYWEIIHDAIKQGFHSIDMGRSPAGSNASKFKGQWGGVAHPIYQQGIVFGQDSSPYRGIELKQERLFQLVRHLWPRLPLSVARFLGPKLRRYVPFA
jgi:hypothetical protein